MRSNYPSKGNLTKGAVLRRSPHPSSKMSFRDIFEATFPRGGRFVVRHTGRSLQGWGRFGGRRLPPLQGWKAWRAARLPPLQWWKAWRAAGCRPYRGGRLGGRQVAAPTGVEGLADEQCSPLRCLSKLSDKRESANRIQKCRPGKTVCIFIFILGK